jgi:succinate dehydrogenase hydrophobic anchor subunit
MTRLSTRTRTVPQASWSMEYILWIFMRVSGLAMITLAIIGAAGAFWMGARNQLDLQMLWRWMFMPNTYHVSSGDIPDLEPWASAWWQTMQLLVVFFGVSHAFNGVRQVIEDYIGHRITVVLLRGVIFVAWLAMLLVAAFVVFQA